VVALEVTAREAIPAARLAGEVPLHDEVALACRGAGDEEIDARTDDRPVVRVERDLLSDDGREVAVEREQELLDVPALLVALEADRGSAEARVREDAGVEEVEERVDAAVVEEAEAADLVALERLVQPRARRITAASATTRRRPGYGALV
jgi:hypothetical protein